MVSTVTYTRIDAKHPAVFSPAVIGLIRKQLGFDGVVISDDLGAAKSMAAVPSRRRAVDFVKAGGDVAITVAPGLAAAFVQGIGFIVTGIVLAMHYSANAELLAGSQYGNVAFNSVERILSLATSSSQTMMRWQFVAFDQTVAT